MSQDRRTHVLVALVLAMTGMGMVGVGGSTSMAADSGDRSVVGEWLDSGGGRTVFNFVPSGRESFTGQVVGKSSWIPCLPIDIKVTGSGGKYSGTTAFYSYTDGQCGAREAGATIVIDLAADGTAAKATFTPPNSGAPTVRKWSR